MRLARGWMKNVTRVTNMWIKIMEGWEQRTYERDKVLPEDYCPFDSNKSILSAW